LDKTRDERVDRHICVHSPYYGEWNYDIKQCKIDDPELKKEYEKEQKENSRFDKLICPRYGGEWNDKEKKCEIEDLEERTAYEDYLCDDPADTILYCDPSFAQTPSEQITEYDKNQCIHVFDGKWNEKILSCETENPDYQKYLKERHDIYFCISLGGKWNDQKNTCETKPPRHPNGDHDRRDHDDGKRHYKEVIKIINNNVIIVRGFDNIEREIFVIGDANICPAQNSTVTLSGKINPNETRLLGDFYPCYIEDGSVTLNIPDTQNIKLAVLSMDEIGNYYQTALIDSIKIQKINANQTLFTVELDNSMTGINPNTGQRTSVTNINGLALYNDGNNTVQFTSAGNNIAALTASFTK
jgi:hypothetical protein